MTDWKAQRKAKLEEKIQALRKEAEETERLIAAVETDGVLVSPADDSTVCCYGTDVDVKGLLVSATDETFLVEAGCNDDTAVITFATSLRDQPKIVAASDDDVELVNIVFGSTKEALAALRAATVVLKAQLRRKE